MTGAIGMQETSTGERQKADWLLFFLAIQVVIIQPVDTGNKAHPYGHALVAGIERYPSKITRRMSKARQEKRSKIKPFVKVVNYNHLMPTRYTLELEGLKGAITSDTFKEVSQREDAKKTVKKTLEERYTSGKNRWFFTPLSMFNPNRDGTPARNTPEDPVGSEGDSGMSQDGDRITSITMLTPTFSNRILDYFFLFSAGRGRNGMDVHSIKSKFDGI